MQVKISYTAEDSDVPKEVSNILNTVIDEGESFIELVQETKDLLIDSDLQVSRAKMKQMTEKLQKLFARLTDCQVILDSYEKMLAGQLNQQVTQDNNAKSENQNR